MYDRALETLDRERLRAHQWTRFVALAGALLDETPGNVSNTA